MKRKILVLLLFLVLAGVADSLYLTWEHYSGFIPPCSAHFTFIDCGKVLQSGYSLLFGIPLALFGVFHYFLLSIIVLTSLLSPKKIFRFLLVFEATVGFVASLYFMYLQLIVLQSLCLYCTLSALISFVIFFIVQYFFDIDRKGLVAWFSSILYRIIFKPVFFLINPEIIHEGMTSFGELLGSTGIGKTAVDFLFKIKTPLLKQKISGISFPNPVGLAAGFDYDAKLTQILPSVHFGFETVGTMTNLPYGGNPPPRLGRLPKSRSLMVNKGFKNMGVKKIIGKLENKRFDIPIGISIGRTNPGLKTPGRWRGNYPDKTPPRWQADPELVEGEALTPRMVEETELKKSVADIVSAFTLLEKSNVRNSYYELNISCPNLFGDISFYPVNNLKALLTALNKLKIKKPVFVKMPINETNQQIIKMLDLIIQFKFIKGVIFGNLQKDRKDPSFYPEEVRRFKRGNFSGKPTEKRSNELIKLAYRKYGKKLVIIGCGGIFSAKDAYRKIKLGASLVQLITGMIFEGPQLITQINLDLMELLQKDGFKNISEAVGKES